MPDCLVVLKLNRDGSADVIYNGPAARVWDAAGKAAKNGQRKIGLGRLRKLDAEVEPGERLREARPFGAGVAER